MAPDCSGRLSHRRHPAGAGPRLAGGSKSRCSLRHSPCVLRQTTWPPTVTVAGQVPRLRRSDRSCSGCAARQVGEIAARRESVKSFLMRQESRAFRKEARSGRPMPPVRRPQETRRNCLPSNQNTAVCWHALPSSTTRLLGSGTATPASACAPSGEDPRRPGSEHQVPEDSAAALAAAAYSDSPAGAHRTD